MHAVIMSERVKNSDCQGAVPKKIPKSFPKVALIVAVLVASTHLRMHGKPISSKSKKETGSYSYLCINTNYKSWQ